MDVLLIFVVFGSLFFSLSIFSILKLFVSSEKMQKVDLVQHQSRLFSPSVSVYIRYNTTLSCVCVCV